LFRGWDKSHLNFEGVEDLRHGIGKMLFNRSRNAYEVGLTLGIMAGTFAARSPSQAIARKLLHDIIRPRFNNADISIDYEPAKSLFSDIDDGIAANNGIDTAIIDWWLCDDDFVLSVEDHHERVDRE